MLFKKIAEMKLI